MKKKIVAVIISMGLLLGMSLTMAACSDADVDSNTDATSTTEDSSDSEKRTFIVNIHPTSYGDIMLLVMQDKGLIEKYMPEGVSVEYTSLTSGSDMRDALVTGATNLATPNIFVLAAAKSNGIDLTYVAREGYQGPYNLYTNNADIESITDLTTDCKISVPALTGGPHLTFLCMLKDAGMDASAFSDSIIILSNADALASLESGVEGLDASMISFPTNAKCDETEGVYLLAEGSDTVKNWDICATFCTSPEYAEENPDIIEGFLQAREEALDSFENDFEYWVQLAAEKWEISEELARETLETFPFTDGDPMYFDELMEFVSDAGVFAGAAPTWEEIDKFN